jgi:hypothetical protein
MTKDEALRLALEALEDLGMKHYENTGEVLYKETFTAIKAALEAKDTLKWKLRGHTTLDLLQNEKIAESFGWGKGESYDDCICCSAFNLHDFAEAIRFDERERLVGKTQEPEPDKSSLFSYKTLIAYAASCVAEALSDIRQQSQLEAKDEPVAWVRWDEEENYYDVRRTPPPQEAIEYLAKWNRPAWVPAYPTPPQRKPLTDEEIYKIANDLFYGNKPCDTIAMCRAIEAAHGIKGEA